MESRTPPGKGECDHTQPAEVARLGEEWLRARGIPEPRWDGCRFGYGGDGGTGPWKSVYTEVERRGAEWVAVKLDRRKDPLPPNQQGFRAVRIPDSAGTGTGT